ncbi:MAG TPA: UDP-glucuronic acid decarboxylase family protein [Ktedonobacterales bacterium]|nr:UDP-glucuronic acid decarboxylase family protein [Ktedonobacterales bacterium]
MNVLVTGGAGFIGSHLCARLLDEGYTVLCVDNLLTGSRSNIEALLGKPRFTFLHHDIVEPLAFEAEVVFHLASPASPVGYMEHPFETILVNSMGTYRILQRVREAGARFLITSTSEIYGDPLEHPQREDYFGNVNPVGPRACYDESKRLGETITMEFCRQYGVDARIVRIFNTYGPHSQLEDGRIIPNFITQSLGNQPLTIHGDGSQTRSLCYVTDLVDGLMRAMFTPGTTGEIYNLGNPEEHTVLEYARLITRLCESSSELVFVPKRQDDPDRRRPDIRKAREQLGWEPTVGLEAGMLWTINWFRQELARQSVGAQQLPVA